MNNFLAWADACAREKVGIDSLKKYVYAVFLVSYQEQFKSLWLSNLKALP